jgi:hypothetical protein
MKQFLIQMLESWVDYIIHDSAQDVTPRDVTDVVEIRLTQSWMVDIAQAVCTLLDIKAEMRSLEDDPYVKVAREVGRNERFRRLVDSVSTGTQAMDWWSAFKAFITAKGTLQKLAFFDYSSIAPSCKDKVISSPAMLLVRLMPECCLRAQYLTDLFPRMKLLKERPPEGFEDFVLLRCVFQWVVLTTAVIRVSLFSFSLFCNAVSTCADAVDWCFMG